MATGVYCALTGVLAFFAWRAFKGTQKQVSVMEAQVKAMEEARRAGVRPLVVLERLERQTAEDENHCRIKLRLKNIGVGPALAISFEVWLKALPTGADPRNPVAISEIAPQLTHMQDHTKPFVGGTPAMGAGVERILKLTPQGDAREAVLDAAEHFAALVTLRFHDVFCEDPAQCDSPLAVPESDTTMFLTVGGD